MDITFSCADCGQHLVVDESGTGLVVPCPKCRQMLRIPAASTRLQTASRESAATSAAPSSTGPVHQDIGRDLVRLLVMGEERGPYTTGQLQTMWTHKQITADAKYRKDNEREWRPIFEISSLLESTEAAPPRSISPPRKPERSVARFNSQPTIPKADKWMLVLGSALLGIGLLGLLGFLGYEFHISSRQSAEAKVMQQDPWSLLKQHVGTMQKNYAEVFHTRIIKLNYDVQKTGSLVSPYIGHVDWTTDFGRGAVVKYKATLVLEDGAWVLENLQKMDVFDGRSWEEVSPSDNWFKATKLALGL